MIIYNVCWIQNGERFYREFNDIDKFDLFVKELSEKGFIYFTSAFKRSC